MMCLCVCVGVGGGCGCICVCVCVSCDLCPVYIGIKAVDRSDIFAAAVKQTAKPSRLQEMSKR
jgi:hypothetical protein